MYYLYKSCVGAKYQTPPSENYLRRWISSEDHLYKYVMFIKAIHSRDPTSKNSGTIKF
jgi:hypothetical protein